MCRPGIVVLLRVFSFTCGATVMLTWAQQRGALRWGRHARARNDRAREAALCGQRTLPAAAGQITRW